MARTPTPAQAPSVAQVTADLLRHPGRHFVRGWNTKAAALSALYRAVIFFFTTLKAGVEAALAALTVEAVFRVVASGFYGAVAQALRHAQPLWLSALIVTLALPAAIQALEALVHLQAGTPHLWRGLLVSTIAAGLSSLFMWFAMRRGAFLVGEDARPFREDLQHYPYLLAEFLLAGPRWIWRRIRYRGR